MKEKNKENMIKESERLNTGLSLLWFFQLFSYSHVATKDWHLSWPQSTHNPIQLHIPWDGSDAESAFPYSTLESTVCEAITLSLVAKGRQCYLSPNAIQCPPSPPPDTKYQRQLFSNAARCSCTVNCKCRKL